MGDVAVDTRSIIQFGMILSNAMISYVHELRVRPCGLVGWYRRPMSANTGGRRTVRGVGRRGGPRLSVSLASALPRTAAVERFLLKRWWNRASPEMLDRYLVSGYQNPRINVQSILVRHFLVRRIFGAAADLEQLMSDELDFAIELNETMRVTADELGVTMGAFLDRDKAEG